MHMEKIVKRFYEELDNGRIMGRRCPACGNVEFPPVIACNRCGNFETEWIEMSGRAQATQIVMPSSLSDPDCEMFMPYALCSVKPEEDAREINAIVCGISPENQAEMEAKLPLPVKAVIVQRDGYRAIVYELVKA